MLLSTCIRWSQVSQSISAHGESRHSLLTPLTYCLLSSRSRCGCCWRLSIEVKWVNRSARMGSHVTRYSRLSLTYCCRHAVVVDVVIDSIRWIKWVSRSAHMGSHVTRYSPLSLTLCCRHAVVVDVVIDIYRLRSSGSIDQCTWGVTSLATHASHLPTVVVTQSLRMLLLSICWLKSSESVNQCTWESRHSLLTPLTYCLLSSRSRCGCCCRHVLDEVKWVNRSAHMGSHVTRYSRLSLTLCCRHAVVVDVVIDIYRLRSSGSIDQCTWESRHSLLTPLTYALLSSRSRCGCCWQYSLNQVNQSISAHGESRHSLLTPLTYCLLSSRSRCGCCCRHVLDEVKWVSQSINQSINRSARMGSHVTCYSRLSLTPCCRHAVVADVVDVYQSKSSGSINQRTWGVTSLATHASHLRPVVVTQSLWVLLTFIGWSQVSQSINAHGSHVTRYSRLSLTLCCRHAVVADVVDSIRWIKWVNRSVHMGSHVTRYSRLSLTYCCRHAVVVDVVDVYRLKSSQSINQRAWGVTSLATHASHLRTVVVTQSLCMSLLTFIVWGQVVQSINAHGESRHSLLTPLTYALLSSRSRCGCRYWHLSIEVKWFNRSVHMESHVTRYSRLSLTTFYIFINYNI